MMLRKWNSCEVLYNTRSVSSDMSIIHHFLTSVNEQRGRMQRSVGSTGDLPYTGFFGDSGVVSQAWEMEVCKRASIFSHFTLLHIFPNSMDCPRVSITKTVKRHLFKSKFII